MAHKTMIDSTVYEIASGKTMVDGTAYDISKGISMVDGADVELNFGGMVTVNLTGSAWVYYDKNAMYVEIGGVQYRPEMTVEVDSAESIFLQAYSIMYHSNSYISINGVNVSTATSSGNASYTLSLRGLKEVNIHMDAKNDYAGYIEVTTR